MLRVLTALITSLILLFSFPSSAFAATVSITSSPGSAQITSEFTVSFTASGLDASSNYYVKVRIGVAGSSSNPYTQAETKNNDSWYADSISWTNFPTVTTDAQGVVSGSIQVRTKSSASTSDNSLILRIRKVGTQTSVDSTAVTISLSAAPTPSPTPSPSITPSPTPKASQTSSSSATSTPTASPVPTSAATSKPKSTATPKPKTPTPSPEIVETKVNTGPVVLGATQEVPTPTPEAKLAGVFTSFSPVAIVLIVFGIGLLVFSAFSFFKGPRSDTIFPTDESR